MINEALLFCYISFKIRQSFFDIKEFFKKFASYLDLCFEVVVKEVLLITMLITFRVIYYIWGLNNILYLLLNVIPGQLCLCNLFRWSVSIHADAHSSHERFSLLVLACVASGAEMGRRLGGREKGGGLEREDKVSSSSLFPFALFSLSSSPYPSPFCACYSGYVRLQ